MPYRRCARAVMSSFCGPLRWRSRKSPFAREACIRAGPTNAAGRARPPDASSSSLALHQKGIVSMSQLRRFTCVVLTLLSLSAFAKEQFLHDATPEELAMKSVEMAPGAQAVVLQWDHRQDDFTNWESEYVRIKIFDRDAAKYGDIELPYFAGYTWIKDMQARTIHADGTVVPFTGKTYDKLLVKASGLKVMAK